MTSQTTREIVAPLTANDVDYAIIGSVRLDAFLAGDEGLVAACARADDGDAGAIAAVCDAYNAAHSDGIAE